MKTPVSSWEYARQKRLEEKVEKVIEKLPEDLPVTLEPPAAPVFIRMPDGTLKTPEDCLAYFESERKKAKARNAVWNRYMTQKRQREAESTASRARSLCGSHEKNIVGRINTPEPT